MAKPNPMGSTFAERAAAAAGKASFTAPDTDPERGAPNTTFAERGKAVGASDAEDKSVKATAAKKK